MTLLKPAELRHTLKFSRSTEYRLLKYGMPSLGAGKLRRYEGLAAVEWFRSYQHHTSISPKILAEKEV